MPVDGIRIIGRSSQGVIVFNTADGEQVVSVERITDDGDEAGDAAIAGENGQGDDAGDAGDAGEN